jgi:uncharacterized lipoprotein YmbA
MRLISVMLFMLLTACATEETPTYHYSCNEVQMKDSGAHKIYIHCERLLN